MSEILGKINGTLCDINNQLGQTEPIVAETLVANLCVDVEKETDEIERQKQTTGDATT